MAGFGAMVRMTGLTVFLIIFLLLFLPIQYICIKFGWPLRHKIPVIFSRTICTLLGIRVVIHGTASPNTPQIRVANHVSWTDILVLGTQQPVCFLAKKEVAAWPIFGFLAKVQGCIFVDRTRRMGIPLVNIALAERMRGDWPVVIFAEGTTGDGNRLKKFYSSHMAAARDYLAVNVECESVSVQPVTIIYSRHNGLLLNRVGRSFFAWYGDTDMLPHLWSLLKSGTVQCDLFYAPPILFRRNNQRKEMTVTCRSAIHQHFTSALTGREQLLPVKLETLESSEGMEQTEFKQKIRERV